MISHEPNESERTALRADTRDKDRLIAQTVLPVAIVVIGIKLNKLLFSFVATNGLAAALKMAAASWSVRIAAAVVAGYVIGRILCPRRKWLLALAPFGVFLPAKLIQAAATGEPQRSYAWLMDAAQQFWLVFASVVGVIRLDVVFLASFAILAYVTVRLTPSRYRRALETFLAAGTGLLLLLSGLELAQYCKTGWTGTGHLLGYVATNATTLWPMLRSQLDVASISALFAPLLTGVAIGFLVRRWYVQPAFGIKPWPLKKAFPAVLACLAAAEIFRPPLADHRFDRFTDDTYLGLRDLLPWRTTGQLQAMKRASRLPLIFDTSRAVLVARTNAPATPRNVIIVMLESARADSTSIGNPTVGSTPFLADFAKRGAVVPNMYAVVPRTCAAWVAVLGGVWPSTDEEMAPWARSGHTGLRWLPALLATRGYASAFFSAAHLSFGYDGPLIHSMGFDSVQDADTLPNQGFERPSFWGYEDRILLKPSLDWVKQQHDNQRPFLLVLMTNVGHYDYKYPAKWPGRSHGSVDPGYNSYLNCLGYVDSVIKDLVAGLEKLGVLRSSFVIILGDHGESFGEHGPRLHSLELYEETVKIPAILYADDLIAPGSSISGVRQEVDVLPTVLDAVGVRAKAATLPGSSLLRPVAADRPVYFSCALYSQSTAMRRGGLKFIYDFGRNPTEAYAIERDPGERHDLAATLPHQTVAKAEMEMLLWRERVSRAFSASTDTHAAVH